MSMDFLWDAFSCFPKSILNGTNYIWFLRRCLVIVVLVIVCLLWKDKEVPPKPILPFWSVLFLSILTADSTYSIVVPLPFFCFFLTRYFLSLSQYIEIILHSLCRTYTALQTVDLHGLSVGTQCLLYLKVSRLSLHWSFYNHIYKIRESFIMVRSLPWKKSFRGPPTWPHSYTTCPGTMVQSWNRTLCMKLFA